MLSRLEQKYLANAKTTSVLIKVNVKS